MRGSVHDRAIADLAHRTETQATGVEQIRHAVSQINEITQDNGRMVRESAAMAGTLRDESAQLETGMRMFKV